MDKKTIEAGNKLIGEFIGWKFIKWCGDEDEVKIPLYQRFSEAGEVEHPGVFHEPMFDSWNNLMPVVEKIEQLGYDSRIHTNDSESTHFVDFVDIENNEAACVVMDYHIGSKLDAVWQAVLEFIKWHNTNKDAH